VSTVSLPALLRRALRGIQRSPRRARPVQRMAGVCPPALQPAVAAAPGWRASLRDWLDTGLSRPARLESERQAPARLPIDDVRAEFMQSLADIRTQQVGMLQQRISIARSMNELWHLRPEVFKLVALRYSQYEAQSRLDRLNRHFPTRAPRSGFGSFESAASAPRRTGKRP